MLGSWGEILIIVVAALILIGPREAPEVIRACGRWLYRLRKMSAQFRHGLDELLQEGQLEEYERVARLKVESAEIVGTQNLSGHSKAKPAPQQKVQQEQHAQLPQKGRVDEPVSH